VLTSKCSLSEVYIESKITISTLEGIASGVFNVKISAALWGHEAPPKMCVHEPQL